jgi:hypothetical protein
MKTMELGVCSTFFLEQIHGGAGGVGCVWRKKIWSGAVFFIWSCVELSQTRPKSNSNRLPTSKLLHPKLLLLFLFGKNRKTFLRESPSQIVIYLKLGKTDSAHVYMHAAIHDASFRTGAELG